MKKTIQNRIARTLGSTALGLAMLTGVSAAQDGPYLAQDGLLVVEFESESAVGDWDESTSPTGFTGSSFFRWDGPNLFSTPGHDVFGFDFQIEDPGRYHFRIRNRHDHPDSTEANDVWVRMDGGPWVKVFSWQRGVWTWTTQHEFSHDDKPHAEYQLDSGLHRIEFSGRSNGFMIDRFHLYMDSVTNAASTSHPQSPRGETNDRPVAIAQVSPAAIPAGDNGSTVVTLDSRRSVDPDGDPIQVRWNVRGATFVEGTNENSRVAKVTFRGGFALPVQLVVTDGELRDTAWGDIDVLDADATFSGAGCVWQPLTLDFEGPTFTETSTSPNPFLDRRLNVTFRSPSGEETVVPGFFDGNGVGGGTGNIWRVRFAPDAPGIWTYTASFRSGENVAISLDENAGSAASFNGATGAFGVMPRDVEAPGLLADGRLEYVEEHYLKQRDGDFFIKTGTNSPENFLAYAGFDDVQDSGGLGIIHRYEPHRGDWRPGDPAFRSATTGYDSRGIIGALNYLGGQGVNSIYFLPMNLGGDGQDTTPFVSYDNTSFAKTHYDISRLTQWNMTLNHAQERGMLVHFVLAETESANENWLDGGTMGTQRKLYFRELVARFGYLNGIKWNLSEENDYSIATLREMASYMKAIDPFDSAIAVHTHPNSVEDYEIIVGDPLFDAASIQYDTAVANGLTQAVRNMSRQAGHKWIIDMDENGTWDVGVNGSNASQMRCEVLYDVLLSNGGIEWYAGYHALPLGGDLRLEDFRTREEIWRYSRIAREFLEEHMDVSIASPGDTLLTGDTSSFGGGEVLVQGQNRFAIFLPDAQGNPRFNLSAWSHTYQVRWFNPRTGEEIDADLTMTGGAVRNLPIPSIDRNQDWLVLIERTN